MSRTPNVANLARMYAEVMIRRGLPPVMRAKKWLLGGFESREAWLKSLGYKTREPWQSDPFVRKMGALND